MAEGGADALDPRRRRAAMIRRLALATAVPLFFLGGPFLFGVGAAAASLEGGMTRFSLARIGFVLGMAVVPLSLGAVTAEIARPHPVGGPAVFTAAFVTVWGLIAYRNTPDFAFFLYTAVTAPAFLLGVVGHAAVRVRWARWLHRADGGG